MNLNLCMIYERIIDGSPTTLYLRRYTKENTKKSGCFVRCYNMSKMGGVTQWLMCLASNGWMIVSRRFETLWKARNFTPTG